MIDDLLILIKMKVAKLETQNKQLQVQLADAQEQNKLLNETLKQHVYEVESLEKELEKLQE